jgi:hypothetical protein
MPDPMTLAGLEATALTQGINFLYGQAAELLKRRRERKDMAAQSSPDSPILAGRLATSEVDEEVLKEHHEELRELAEQLRSYATGARKVDEPPDAVLIAKVEALRGLLELAYRQRITFEGEDREPTGTAIDIKLVAGRVDGDLTVADIGVLRGSSRVSATGEVGDVGPGARVTGFRGNVIGSLVVRRTMI